MSLISEITRRKFIAGSAALTTASLSAPLAMAKAPLKDAGGGIFSRVKLGSYDVTTLLDGQRTVGDIQTIFGMNVSKEEFAKVSAENLIPADKSQFFFTPTVVNTGNELVLFDTGLGESGNIVGALAAAGYTPDQVDVVVITHMHPDHIGGLILDGKPTFPNARYIAGSTEYDFWNKQDPESRIPALMAKKVKPIADQFSFIKGGDSVASGITAMETFGHTPGHMAYMVESDGEQIALLADMANHYVWSLAYPDWEVKFDMDKQAAAATRRKVLDMLATDKIPFVGYHMPFPATGYVETRGSGFKYVPTSYQLKL
jgi:glyoxylase-like metal-dependent hydrolase (beta-lactamase superfamily II)